MRLRGLGLGRVGMEKLKNSHKGGCYAKISHKGMCCAKISHKALFTRANAKLDSFKWPYFFVSTPNHAPFKALDS